MKFHSLIYAAGLSLAAMSATAQVSVPECVVQHNIDTERMMPVRHSAVRQNNHMPAQMPPAPRPGFKIMGTLISASSWPANSLKRPYGVYSATCGSSASAPAVESVALDPLLNPTTGAVMTPQGYLVISTTPYMGYYLVDRLIFDPNDWSLTSRVASDMESMARSLAYNPADGKVYGSFANLDGTFSFSKLDLKSGDRKKIINRMTEPYSALAATDEGTLYAIDAEGSLLSLDLKTGDETLLFELGLPSAYTTSATFDEQNGMLLYVQARGDASELFAIDPADGTTLSYGVFADGEQWNGIYVPAPEALPAAPAAPDNLIADFPDNSLEGTLTFTVPTLLYGGEDAEGEPEWTVYADGEEVASGTCTPGETVTATLKVSTPGQHTFTVRLRNEAGESPAAEISLYVGPDVPRLSSRPVLDYDFEAGVAHLSWTPAAEGSAGNPVNIADVTYDIVRYPGAETVASGLTATEWSEDMPIPEKLTALRYGVIPVHAGTRGELWQSNSVALGSLSLPYEADFTQPDGMEAFHLEDANGDGITWQTDEHGAFVDYSSVQMNDWLISAPFEMRRGMVYAITVDAWSQSVRHDERIAIWLGESMDAGSMKKRLTSRTLDGHPAPMRLLATVEEDGVYHLGLQGTSPAGQYILRLSSVSIEAPVAQAAPDAPRFLSLDPDADDVMSVKGRVLVPIRASDGSSITSLTALRVYRGEEEVASFANPSPGQIVSFTDTPPSAGSYRYSAVAESEQGVGLVGTSDVRAGVNIPANPMNVKLDGNQSEGLTVSWTPSVKGADGLPLNTSDVTYHVYDKNFVEIGSTGDFSLLLPSTETPANAAPEANIFYVRAETEAGLNENWDAASLIVNSNVAADGILRESCEMIGENSLGLSFAGGLPSGRNPWTMEKVGDRNVLTASLEEEEEGAMFILPGVTVGDGHPYFSFTCEGLSEADLNVYVIDGGIVGPVPAENLKWLDYNGIAGVEVPLNDFTGREVNVGVAVMAHGGFSLSDFCIDCRQPLNVMMEALVAPEKHTFGNVNVTARIRNAGAEDSEAFKVVFRGIYNQTEDKLDPDIEDVRDIESLPAGESLELQLTVPLAQYIHIHVYVDATIVDANGCLPAFASCRRYVEVADRGLPTVGSTSASAFPDMKSVTVLWEKPLGLDADDRPTEVEEAAPLSGYKVYADGRLIGETDAYTADYHHINGEEITPETEKTVIYTVVACYGDEESLPGEEALVSLSAIDETYSPDTLRVRTFATELIVEGAYADVEVFTPSGARVAKVKKESLPARISLTPGVYVVTDSRDSVTVGL